MRRIPLRARDGSVRAHALVDDADYEELSRWRWSLSGDGGYARRGARGPGRKYVYVSMHGHLMGRPGSDVDHRNGNGLDNRRENLRVCTHAQNHQNRTRLNANNTSGHRGVTWDRERRKWKAQGKLNGRNHVIGRFTDIGDAVAAITAWRAEHMPFSAEAA